MDFASLTLGLAVPSSTFVTITSIFSFLYSIYTIFKNMFSKKLKPRIRLVEYFSHPEVTHFYTHIENLSTEPLLISSISLVQGKNKTMCELKPVRVATIERKRNGVVVDTENKMSLELPIALGHNQCVSGYLVFYGCQEIDTTQTKSLKFQVQTNRHKALSIQSSFESCRPME